MQWMPMWSGICGQLDICVILMDNPDSLPWLHDRHLRARWQRQRSTLAKARVESGKGKEGAATYCPALVMSSWHSFTFQGQRPASCKYIIQRYEWEWEGEGRSRSYPTRHLTLCPVPDLPHHIWNVPLGHLDSPTSNYLWFLLLENPW